MIGHNLVRIGGKMSVTFNIYYTGKGGNAKKFAEEMMESGVVDKIRAETGNEKYEYFYPVEDKETVLLIDSWSSQEALDKHHASPMMKEIAALREKYDLHMQVEKYELCKSEVDTNLQENNYLCS